MAQTKISALTELAAAPADADELVIVDKSDTTMAGTGTDKKITYVNLVSALRSDITTLQGQTPNAILTTAGDVIYASANGVAARLAKGTAYQRLRMNAGATAPEWGGLVLTSGERGTSLPVSPVDGQRYNYIADDVNGVEWALVYDSSQAKWRCVGGTPVVVSGNANAVVNTQTACGGYWRPTSLTYTIPLAGNYLVWGMQTFNANGYGSNAVMVVLPSIGTTATGTRGIGFLLVATYPDGSGAYPSQILTCAASDVLGICVSTTADGTIKFQETQFCVIPRFVS